MSIKKLSIAISITIIILTSGNLGWTEAALTLKINVIVDEEVSSQYGWQNTLSEAVSRAGSFYSDRFGIQLAIVSWGSWNSPDTLKNLPQLATVLSRRAPLNGEEIIVAVTGQEGIEEKHLGLSSYFGNVVLMKYSGSNDEDAVILTHELGHILGAIHSDNSQSVMYPAPDTAGRIWLDEQNSEIIGLSRDWMLSSSISVEEQLQEVYQRVNSSEAQEALTYFAAKTGGSFSADSASVSDNAQVSFQQGIIFEQRGDYRQAGEEYRQAIMAQDGFAQAHANLGNVYQAEGRFRKAIIEYRKAIELYNQTSGTEEALAVIYFNLGIAFTKKGEYKKAANSYESATQLNCDNPSCYKNLSIIYTQYLDDPVTGQQYLNKSLTL